MNQTRTAPTRLRLLGWAVGILLAGSAALGVRSLLAAPSGFCEGLDPFTICTIGGNQLCIDCCISESGGTYNGGTCDAAPGICVCTTN